MVEQTNKYSIILRLVPPAPQRFFYQRPGQTWGLRGASSMVIQTGGLPAAKFLGLANGKPSIIPAAKFLGSAYGIPSKPPLPASS